MTLRTSLAFTASKTMPLQIRDTFLYSPVKRRLSCDTDPYQGPAQKRQRRLSSEDDSFSMDCPNVDEGPPKTRRVDPSRLALKLHPDLVKEMEEHIYPGAMMPSFTVRKELQVRYAVDRRHLYDYFHSRGLRVAKEDKFNNLSRSRIQKKTELRAQHPSRSSENTSVTANPNPAKVPKRASDPRPFLRPIGNIPTPKSRDTRISEASQAPPALPKTLSTFAFLQSDALPIIELPSPSLSPSPACPIRKRQPSFDVPLEPLLQDSPVEFYDASVWMNEYCNIEQDYDQSVFQQLSSDQQDSPDQVTDLTSDGPIMTENDRFAMYNFIDGALKRINGVGESLGSYGSYMDDLKDLYFAPLCREPRPRTRAGEQDRTISPSCLWPEVAKPMASEIVPDVYSDLSMSTPPLPVAEDESEGLDTPYNIVAVSLTESSTIQSHGRPMSVGATAQSKNQSASISYYISNPPRSSSPSYFAIPLLPQPPVFTQSSISILPTKDMDRCRGAPVPHRTRPRSSSLGWHSRARTFSAGGVF